MNKPKSFLDSFITDQLKAHPEPSREGVPRGDPIGFSQAKHRAYLYSALSSLSEKEISERAGVSYAGLRKWRTEAEFKKRRPEVFEAFEKALVTEGWPEDFGPLAPGAVAGVLEWMRNRPLRNQEIGQALYALEKLAQTYRDPAREEGSSDPLLMMRLRRKEPDEELDKEVRTLREKAIEAVRRVLKKRNATSEERENALRCFEALVRGKEGEGA